MSLESIAFFAKYIEDETGIIYRDINLYQLQTRLEEICTKENFESIDVLRSKFQGMNLDRSLKQKLLDHATNNETLFFRDPTFFLALEEFVLKKILPTYPKEIKVWSAASSSGQEAISVAIILEELSRKHALPPYSIIASDLSEKALSKGRGGIYSDFEVMRGLSNERKDNFFVKESDGWHVKPFILQKILFKQNNLIHSAVSGPFHIILCRNVLIYQKVEMKKTIIESLLKELDPCGGILLGVGETMLGIKEEIEATMFGNVFFYRNKKVG